MPGNTSHPEQTFCRLVAYFVCYSPHPPDLFHVNSLSFQRIENFLFLVCSLVQLLLSLREEEWFVLLLRKENTSNEEAWSMFQSTVCATALFFGLMVANGLTYANEQMAKISDDQPVVMIPKSDSVSTIIQDKDEDPEPAPPSKPEE